MCSLPLVSKPGYATDYIIALLGSKKPFWFIAVSMRCGWSVLSRVGFVVFRKFSSLNFKILFYNFFHFCFNINDWLICVSLKVVDRVAPDVTLYTGLESRPPRNWPMHVTWFCGCERSRPINTPECGGRLSTMFSNDDTNPNRPSRRITWP